MNHLTCFGQTHSTGTAFKKLDPVKILQGMHLTTDSGLAQVKKLCCFGKTLYPGYFTQQFKL
jgi:hypothetical protein